MPSSVARRIFVGALPKKLGEDAFREHFEKFGELIAVELMRRPGDSRNRGFGFVKYSDAETSDKVINMEHVLDGQTLTVNYAKVPMPRDTRRFFIGSINKDKIQEHDLTNYFKSYGEVEDCVIMKEKDFGFIALYNANHSKLDEVLNETHVINGETLKIEAAKPKPSRNRAQVRSLRDGHGGPGMHHRFGGPQRYSPYGRGPMPPGGPWGAPPPYPMHPHGYGYGPPPPHMGGRNPEYETFEVKSRGGSGRPPFQGPGSQYNPQRDASSAAYGAPPPGYGSAPPPSSHAPPPSGSAAPNTYTSYGAPPPSSGATGTPPTGYSDPYNPYSYNQPTYSPHTQAPGSSSGYQAPPTGAPTNYPNSQPAGSTNYPAPGGYHQPQARPTYSQNTYTSYGQPPTY